MPGTGGIILDGPSDEEKKPPDWVLDKTIERMDTKTGEVITKTVGEWNKLGHREGLFNNPNSGEYTMKRAMICDKCGEKIPAPGGNPFTGPEPCPKCGKNPFSPPGTRPRR